MKLSYKNKLNAITLSKAAIFVKIIPYLLEAAQVLGPSVLGYIAEWAKEAKSQDGFTKKEQLKYIREQLVAIKAHKWGDNIIVDAIVDFIIGKVIEEVEDAEKEPSGDAA